MKISLKGIIKQWLPLVLVFQLVLGVLQLLDYWRLPFFPTVNRITSPKNFVVNQSLVLPLLILLGIWIIIVGTLSQRLYSVGPLLSFILLPIYGIEVSLAVASMISVIITIYVFRDFKKYLFWGFLTIGGINILILLHWMLLFPLNIKTPIENLALLELDLFYVASYLAPLIVVPFLFVWLIKHIFTWGWGSQLESKIRYSKKGNKKFAWIILASALVLSIFSVFYAYLPNVNPSEQNVGVDIQSYVDSVKIIDHDISQAFNVSGGSRPLIFFMIISFKRLTGLNYVSAVRYLPIFLNPLFVLSVFFLTHEVYQNLSKASWASFFTACGYQITVNMYSYFLANILGLSLIFFSLGFLFRTLRQGKWNNFLATNVFGVLLVFTHPWTFNQYFSAISMSTVVLYYLYWKDGKDKGNLKPLFSYSVILAVAELVKSQVFKGIGGIAATSTVVNGIVGLDEFWFSSIYNFRLLYGGYISNVLLLCLATVGAYIMNRNEIHEKFLTILLALTSLVFLIGDETIKSRLLFNIPIGLFAALGFLYIHQRFQDRNLKYAFTFFTGSSMLVYFFQSLANLV